MTTDVNDWKLLANGFIVGQVLRCEHGEEGVRIFTKSLSGQVFIQTVGGSCRFIDADILCTPTERNELNHYICIGRYFELAYKGVLYGGYIEGDPTWETIYPGEWYKATIKLVRQDEEI